MTQNIPKRLFLVLSATRWTCGRLVIYIYFFFAHGAHESVGKKKKYFFFSEAERKLFRINFYGSVGKPETRLFFFRSYSSSSLVLVLVSQ